MRFVLKMLSVWIVGGTSSFNVVACNKWIVNTRVDTYDVSFKEISRVNVYVEKDDVYSVVRIWLFKDSVVGSSGLPNTFWDTDYDGKKSRTIEFSKSDTESFNSMLAVYGISWEKDSTDVIEKKIKSVVLVNVSMKIEYNSIVVPSQFNVKVFNVNKNK